MVEVLVITPIDVLDSAVKIGLGAIISGLATYWIAKSNHEKTAEKERAQRRRDLIESVAQQVASANQSVRKHRAYVGNWLKFTATGHEMTESTRQELLSLSDKAADGLRELVSAEAKLALVGGKNCLKLLREYQNEVYLPTEDAVASRSIAIDVLELYGSDLKEKLDAFFDELTRVYKNT